MILDIRKETIWTHDEGTCVCLKTLHVDRDVNLEKTGQMAWDIRKETNWTHEEDTCVCLKTLYLHRDVNLKKTHQETWLGDIRKETTGV